MTCDLNNSGSFWIRAQDRVFVGLGVAEEWKARTWEEACSMLRDMREAPGFKAGYMSYDFGALWQGIESKREDEFNTPFLHFVCPEQVFILDVDNSRAWELLCEYDFRATSPEQDLDEARYGEAIRQIHQYLKDGETYEVNFAHRFHGRYQGNPLEVFRRLNTMNPSPHACYFNFDPVTVVSCSPERLIVGRNQNGAMHLETRPIKGTVPRGGTEEEDQEWIEKLLASEKDEAELNMIVDLARNDLGRVSEEGSVEVSEHRVVESYSHVHHTMSNVRGVLREGLDFVDVMKAVFPGGSITGAPKIRTMEIIDRLESCKRGIYTGSAGYIDEDGQFDFNILIRTLAFQTAMNRYSYHSGGAIVIDSVADSEYQETMDKAAALKSALVDEM